MTPSVFDDFIIAGLDWLAAQGLTLHVEHDPSGLGEFMQAVNYPERLSPAFDSRFNRLDASNFRWVWCEDERGPAASICEKLLPEADSLGSLFRDLRFWYERLRPVDGTVIDLVSDEPDQITGRITYGGQAWRRTDFKGTGLGSMITLIGRAVAVRDFASDQHFAMVKPALHDKRVGTDVYRYAAPGTLWCRWAMPDGLTYDLYGLHATRSEVAAQMRRELDRMTAAARAA